MTFITNWDDFVKAVEQLYRTCADPMRCRFCVKYRHCDGKLVLRMTDDKVCLQYATKFSQDVRKMERLTMQLMQMMVARDR